MQNARLDELQAGIKIGGRNINHFRSNDAILMAESESEVAQSCLTLQPHGL